MGVCSGGGGQVGVGGWVGVDGGGVGIGEKGWVRGIMGSCWIFVLVTWAIFRPPANPGLGIKN